MSDNALRRFFIEDEDSQYLCKDAVLILKGTQAHKMINVLRTKHGAMFAFFNGKDGEWLGEVIAIKKESIEIIIHKLVRPQQSTPLRLLLFAPPKGNRLHHLVEQCTQANCSIFQPFLCRYGVPKKINEERLKLMARAAAEQSGRLSCPTIEPMRPLAEAIELWASEKNTTLFLCHPPKSEKHIDHLSSLVQKHEASSMGFIIGPEGGLTDDEIALCLHHPSIRQVHLGENLYRVDSACFLALSIANL